MYFLSKFLPAFFLPLTIVYFLLILALVSLRKWPRIAFAGIAAALLMLTAACDGWVSEHLMHSLEGRVPTLPAAARADAIVVLGGVTAPDDPPRNTIHLTEGAERLTYAATLYRQGRAPLVIVSGGRPPLVRSAVDASEAQEMSALLQMMGVPPAAIVEDNQSRNTDENALEVKQLLAARHLDRVLLVTSAWHMPRALLIFHQRGIAAIPAPTDYRVLQRDLDSDRWWTNILFATTAGYNLELTSQAIREYLGITFYHIRGKP